MKWIYSDLSFQYVVTLAQHELAGFKEGVGFAYSKCRHCECTFEEMQRNSDEQFYQKDSGKTH